MADKFDFEKIGKDLSVLWGIPTKANSSAPPADTSLTPPATVGSPSVTGGDSLRPQMSPGQLRLDQPEALVPQATPQPQPGAQTTTQVSPGQDQSTTDQTGPQSMEVKRTTTEFGKQPSKALTSEQDQLFNKRVELAHEQANLDTELARQQTNLLEKRNNEIESENSEYKKTKELNDLNSKAAVDRFTAASEKYKSTKAVDPKRYYKERSTGEAILDAIAIGLGQFSAAMNHTQNTALAIVQDKAERDVRSQENELAKAKGDLDLENNSVAFFRRLGMDDLQSHLAAQSLIYDSAKTQAETLAAKSKNPQVQQQLQTFLNDIGTKQNEIRQKIYMDAQGKSSVEKVTQPVGGRSLTDQLKVNELAVEVPQPNGKTKVYYANDPVDARDIRKAITVTKQFTNGLNTMQELIKGNQSLNPQLRERVDALADDLRTQYAVLRNLGALSDKDYKIASILGDPTSWFQRDKTTLKLIDDARARIDTDLISTYEGKGLLKTNFTGNNVK